jgi:predicted transcriptional regulator
MKAATGLRRAALVTKIAVGWLNNPDHAIAADDLPRLLAKIDEAVDAAASLPVPAYAPAVSVEASLASNDYIVSMIDGKRYKGLTKHIASHGLTPDEYRARYGLPPAYPMTSPSYSAERRRHAKENGLGRHIRKHSDI